LTQRACVPLSTPHWFHTQGTGAVLALPLLRSAAAMMSGMGSLEEVMRAGQEAAAAKAADQNQATAAEAANPDSEGQEKRA
jgi:hypothetical protein